MHTHQATRTMATRNAVFAGSVSRHHPRLLKPPYSSLTRMYAQKLSSSRMGGLPPVHLLSLVDGPRLCFFKHAALLHRDVGQRPSYHAESEPQRRSSKAPNPFLFGASSGHLLVSAQVRDRAPYFKARRSCNPTCLRRRRLLSEQDCLISAPPTSCQGCFFILAVCRCTTYAGCWYKKMLWLSTTHRMFFLDAVSIMTYNLLTLNLGAALST
ncbi:uncharacterized protein LY79DRAFT_33608 [Colletotrichum navitas]|uniref:Uncharacterized protein n=1 Tax=Colletotrichum navitas TaxID=681940 RepID=A0AAD8V8E8_9PEZI|nr:uncharacterized protein LY79DRAFT_33608 [Colletotrichum navitas]KAK1596854.1 hypothetical protein LY79DRAFT_33608 [Colletotrichum navitas]